MSTIEWKKHNLSIVIEHILQESNCGRYNCGNCGGKSNLHDWSLTGINEILKITQGNKLPVDLKPTCNFDKPGNWKKPDEILGRPLTGCYGCTGSSSGFENAHWGSSTGSGACSNSINVVANAVHGWLNSPPHRATMLSENQWSNYKWTRLGAAIMTRCSHEGTPKENFKYWANSWFSNLP